MKFLILKGSPRPEGNTNSLVKEFTGRLAELKTAGGSEPSGCCKLATGSEVEWEEFNLYNMDIRPCMACRNCQTNWDRPGCVIDDEMQQLFPKILEADVIVLATPIYSWYATPPVKALLDRCVYALNKYYGDAKGPSIWAGKQLALITTCGYGPEKGADLLEEGLRRYCKHSGLIYRGMLAERHLGYDKVFMDDEKAMRAREFCDILIQLKEI